MELFVELVQVALGNRSTLSRVPSEGEWNEVYKMAEKHTLVGLLFSAIEVLIEKDEPTIPPTPLFYQWIYYLLNIETQNRRLNEAAEHLTRVFNNGGLRCCVLKGQGIAALYTWPLRRQSGDIDIWVEGGRNRVLQFLKSGSVRLGQVVIHHVDAHIIEGIETEVHFIPVYACNPILHYKLQRFFKKYANEQFSNIDEIRRFAYPTLRFNAVYILAHIYMHFLYEGIGLRQIVDYYFVLKKLEEDEMQQAVVDIKTIGLRKFAGAVMYVLLHVCRMDETLFVAESDDKRGALLLEEIMRSGNFGKYDDRLKNRDDKNLVLFNIVALKRQLRFLRYYPMDMISIPFFKVWHWCWRKCKGYL